LADEIECTVDSASDVILSEGGGSVFLVGKARIALHIEFAKSFKVLNLSFDGWDTLNLF